MGDTEVKAFERSLTINTSRLLESYRELLSRAQIHEDDQPQLDSLLTTAAAANIAYASQCLLDQIHQLRLRVVLRADKEKVAAAEQDRKNLEAMLDCTAP